MRSLFLFMAVFFFSALPLVSASEPRARAALISEAKTIMPGEPAWLGLHLALQPGWHVYWRNPGDTGKPPKVEWSASRGVSISAFQWPAPQQFVVGSVVNYGYEGDVLLPFQVTVEKSFSGRSIRISGYASWLICKEECIPEAQSIVIDVPVGASPAVPDPGLAKAFDTAKSAIPRLLQAGEVQVEHAERYRIRMPRRLFRGQEIEAVTFFPNEQDWINPLAPQVLMRDGADWILMVDALENYPVPERLSGALVAKKRGDSALAVSFSELVTQIEPESAMVYWIFAFLGGLILNLMPCVFPVLGIKLLSVLQSSTREQGYLRKHAYMYTLGVLVSFWAIAGILLVVQGLGREVGWGFQLQQPWFVVLLCLLFFLMALNLLSVFEFGGRWIGLGQRLTRQEGAWGSFFTGALAVVVATPCSAPFMGAAVGAALLQPGFATVLIFTCLGLGLAAPYLILSVVPGWIQLLPKPGLWMERLKEFLALPLLGTVLWLLWVLRAQVSVLWLGAVLFGLALVFLSLMLIRRKSFSRIHAAILLVFFAMGLAISLMPRMGAGGRASSTTLNWEKFSEQSLSALRATKRPVFIEFTADWCITCKVNESLVLQSAAFEKIVQENKITLLRADWTNEDPEISRVLKSYGRVGVPLYVLFPPEGEALILPQVLTVGDVQNALLR